MANKKSKPPEAPEDIPEQAAVPEPSPEIEEWKDKFLRVQAELVNYRNRTQREMEQRWSESRADTVKELLPVLDNLERALETPCSDQAYKQGVELTLRQFTELLAKLGVEEIAALEQPFDPQWMDAVLHEESDTLGENTVAQVFTKGYKLGDRVLRHAVVKVVN
ncbi:MAG: nucleotide exchange factor GrpE [Oscillospiraceae bacterium]|nr:nucleotide exchange factor GrpE [Oscillospiraceae bacterium]